MTCAKLQFLDEKKPQLTRDTLFIISIVILIIEKNGPENWKKNCSISTLPSAYFNYKKS